MVNNMCGKLIVQIRKPLKPFICNMHVKLEVKDKAQRVDREIVERNISKEHP